MTDPLTATPDTHPPLPPSMLLRLLRGEPAITAVTALLVITLSGCTDSHSEEFVEFADLPPSPDAAVTANESQDTALASEETQQPDPASSTADTADSSPTDSSADIRSDNAVEAARSGQPEEKWQSRSDSEPVAANRVRDPFLAEPRKPAGTTTQPGSAEKREPLPIKLLVPRRQFRKEGEALRATFDDIDLLKVLNMEPVPLDAADHFPDWLKQLNGARVRIRGYMRPDFYVEDITEFLFVRDNGECCYGPMPKIYDMIAVQLAEGESTDLIEGTPFDVEGTFRIDPHADEVELFALFFIDDGVIID